MVDAKRRMDGAERTTDKFDARPLMNITGWDGRMVMVNSSRHGARCTWGEKVERYRDDSCWDHGGNGDAPPLLPCRQFRGVWSSHNN